MTLLAGCFVFFLGLCIGSFLNVCIYRLPREMSLVRPPSHCPTCNEPIGWYDNIPVLSWLSLGGLCRRCGVAISPRYLLVELLTGGVFLWAYLAQRPAQADSTVAWLPGFGASVVLASALIASSFIDIERMVIPDEVSIGGMYAGPVLCAIWPGIIKHDALITGWLLRLMGAPDSERLAGLAASVVGMAFGASLIYAAAVFGRILFHKEAMGFGDVKFMGMIGAFIGWQAAALAFFVACVYGAAIGIVLLIRRRDTHIPFGPYLAAGAFTMMLYGDRLVRFLPDPLQSLFT